VKKGSFLRKASPKKLEGEIRISLSLAHVFSGTWGMLFDEVAVQEAGRKLSILS